MGRAILIKDGINKDDQLNAQTIQSAASNGLATNAQGIDLTNALSAVNRPQLVSSSTPNAPTDLAWGVKQVIIYSATNALITIKGVTNLGLTSEWHSIVVVNDGVTTVGSWTSFLALDRITTLENTVNILIDRINDITRLLTEQSNVLTPPEEEEESGSGE